MNLLKDIKPQTSRQLEVLVYIRGTCRKKKTATPPRDLHESGNFCVNNQNLSWWQKGIQGKCWVCKSKFSTAANQPGSRLTVSPPGPVCCGELQSHGSAQTIMWKERSKCFRQALALEKKYRLSLSQGGPSKQTENRRVLRVSWKQPKIAAAAWHGHPCRHWPSDHPGEL